MKKINKILCSLCMVFMLIGCSKTPKEPTNEEIVQEMEKIILTEDFDAADQYYTENLKQIQSVEGELISEYMNGWYAYIQDNYTIGLDSLLKCKGYLNADEYYKKMYDEASSLYGTYKNTSIDYLDMYLTINNGKATIKMISKYTDGLETDYTFTKIHYNNGRKPFGFGNSAVLYEISPMGNGKLLVAGCEGYNDTTFSGVYVRS